MTDRVHRRGFLPLGIAILCVAAVAAALVSQHVYDMQPCPWCVLQRLIFVVIAALALVTAAWQTSIGQRLGGGAMVLLAIGGVASALWQHHVAAASSSCNQTLADRIVSGLGLDGSLPEIFQARASCADAAVDLWGLPYAYWSLALFVVITLLAGRVMLSR